MSGRLVAPITITSPISSNPSSSVRSWLTTRSETLLPISCPREGARLSSSSKKMIVGETCRALRKVCLIAFSDSPTHFERSCGPLTEMKLAFVSLATAFAISVLPVPGGPYSRTPFGASTPMRSNFSGEVSGHSTDSWTSCFASVRPPTSSHEIFGSSTSTSRIAEGSTSFKAPSKSSRLTIMRSMRLGGMSSSSRSISGR